MTLRQPRYMISPIQTMLQVHLRLFLRLSLHKPLGKFLLLEHLGLLLLLVCLQCGVALCDLHLPRDVAQPGANDVAVPDYGCAAVDCDV